MILFLLKLATTLIMIGYLLIQSKLDARSGYTYKHLNDFILAFSAMLLFCSIANDCPSIFFFIEFITIFLLLLLSTINLPKIGKFMQPADGKAYLSIYMTSCCIVGYDFGLYIMGISLIIANISAIIWYRIIKKCDKKARKPYFPFITIGYIITQIFYWLAYFIFMLKR